jgi:hypothetical protein
MQSVEWLPVTIGIVTGRLGLIPGRDGFLFATTVSNPAPGPIQPPVQWRPGTASLGARYHRMIKDHSHAHRKGTDHFLLFFFVLRKGCGLLDKVPASSGVTQPVYTGYEATRC